jgi:hypothetical protein
MFRAKQVSISTRPVNIAAARHEIFGLETRVTALNNHFRFVFAHRALCAAAVLARPSALIFLRGLAVAGIVEPNGRPRFAGVGVGPFNRVRTCSRREISACILSMISLVVMNSPRCVICEEKPE